MSKNLSSLFAFLVVVGVSGVGMSADLNSATTTTNYWCFERWGDCICYWLRTCNVDPTPTPVLKHN
jgi:hypothetical protein